MTLGPRQAGLVESLVGATSGPELQALLEAALGPGPVVLRLYDAPGGMFHAIDGVAPPLPAGSGPGLHLCSCRGEAVGLLESAHSDAALAALVLGPALVAIQLQDLCLGRLRIAEDKVRAIVDAGSLLREFDVERVLNQSMQAMLGMVRSDIGALLAVEDGALHLRVAWGLDGSHLERLRLRDGRWLPDAVLADGRARIWDQAGLAAELAADAGEGVHLAGLLALPLVVADRRLGVVLAVNAEDAFSDRDREMVETLAQIAAIALDNARLVTAGLEHERLASTMAIARQVQQGIYPKTPLAWRGCRVAGMARTCDETGGDYFQYQAFGDRLAVVVGDVSGHGLGAALYSTMAHAGLLQALRGGAGPAAAFAAVSEGMAACAIDDAFMTAAMAVVAADGRSLRWCCAGHPEGLLLSRDGDLRRLGGTGLPLGMFPDTTYDEVEVATGPGDLLLLFTDGVTECWDRAGRLFGDKRLEDALRRHAGADPEAIVAAIIAETEVFAAGEPIKDDIAVVALRLGG